MLRAAKCIAATTSTLALLLITLQPFDASLAVASAAVIASDPSPASSAKKPIIGTFFALDDTAPTPAAVRSRFNLEQKEGGGNAGFFALGEFMAGYWHLSLQNEITAADSMAGAVRRAFRPTLLVKCDLFEGRVVVVPADAAAAERAPGYTGGAGSTGATITTGSGATLCSAYLHGADLTGNALSTAIDKILFGGPAPADVADTHPSLATVRDGIMATMNHSDIVPVRMLVEPTSLVNGWVSLVRVDQGKMYRISSRRSAITGHRAAGDVHPFVTLNLPLDSVASPSTADDSGRLIVEAIAVAAVGLTSEADTVPFRQSADAVIQAHARLSVPAAAAAAATGSAVDERFVWTFSAKKVGSLDKPPAEHFYEEEGFRPMVGAIALLTIILGGKFGVKFFLKRKGIDVDKFMKNSARASDRMKRNQMEQRKREAASARYRVDTERINEDFEAMGDFVATTSTGRVHEFRAPMTDIDAEVARLQALEQEEFLRQSRAAAQDVLEANKAQQASAAAAAKTTKKETPASKKKK
jgi:hypothetical protein